MVGRLGVLAAFLLALAGATAAYARRPGAPRLTPAARAQPHRAPAATPAPAPAAPAMPALFPAFEPIRVSNLNTREERAVALYDKAGRVDEAAAQTLDALLSDARDPKHPQTTLLSRRVLQLMFRAAYHFHAEQIEVISAYRKPGRHREGLHASGRAIDFKLPGTPPATLAAYLRTLPRVGVGVYTHPRTQFVHLDVREQSYHWLDASPPGRTWRGLSLGTAALATRDAAYDPSDDWPEGSHAP